MMYYAVKRVDGKGCVTRSGEWSDEKKKAMEDEGFLVFTDQEEANRILKEERDKSRKK